MADVGIALDGGADVALEAADGALLDQVGAAAMAGSSRFVVLNSLRLRWTALEPVS